MLSDNPVEAIGSHAFTIPREDLVIYMIRTKTKTVSLRSFYGIDNLTIDISLNEGKIGIMKFRDDERNCTIHL
ncbi:unnamed protein product [Porites evermanni]|uniref:Uncharacterized protein n=1 Tax=Porites evermanni TaxID=104178 RepID=A0ABN8R673_9CNID|nr:unnamed protein product [Porites evermanni]